MFKIAVPIYSVKISDDEKKHALKVRKMQEGVLNHLDSCIDSLETFANIIAEITDVSDIRKLRKEFIEYKHKIQAQLNEFLGLVEDGLKEWNDMITDATINDIKKASVEEVRKIRDHALVFLEKFRTMEDPKFLQDIPEQVKLIVEAKNAFESVISEQLIKKIDTDILGRMRVGSRMIALSK